MLFSPGLVSFSILYVIPSTKKLFHQVREKYTTGLGAKRAVAFLIGGGLLGMGMTLAGSVSFTTFQCK